MIKKLLYISAFSLIIPFFISGCVNLQQKVKINKDGSGSMNIKYWTQSSNVIGDEIAGFGFTENKIKQNYSSANTSVDNIKISNNENSDSIIYVNLTLDFKDFNKIPEARAFNKTKTSWNETNESIDFRYVLFADTVNARNLGMDNYILNFEFEFPNEILETNGTKDGKKGIWNYKMSDLVQDLELKAKIKKDNNKCGLFGFELPIILAFSLFIIFNKKKYKNNS